ncbi:MAG: FtsX-like permease family protein, partial [Bacteroidota bacterium]
AESALGKTLILNDDTEWKIVGVFEDLPGNSHFHLNLALGMESLKESQNQEWLSHNFYTYLELEKGTSSAQVDQQFAEIILKYVGPQIQQFVGSSMEEMENSGNHIHYYLQPLADIHLGSAQYVYDQEPGGDLSYVYIFSAIALFILLIACINFMNLSTARSANRAREVGVRKALGSQRHHLIAQFLSESIMVTLIAFAIGLLLADLLLPSFNELANKNLQLPWSSWWFVPGMLTGVIIIGLIAGLYPAFFLSAFKPVEVFKGAVSRGVKSGYMRSALVVFQFTTSIVLIVSTTVVYRQLNFVQQKKLGYNKEQVLIIEDPYSLGGDKARALKQAMLQLPAVEKATLTSFLPVSGSDRNNTVFWPEGNRNEETSVIMQYWRGDHDFIQTMGIEIQEGRDFSVEFPTDSQAVIINEEAVRQWGFKDPIGRRLSTFAGGLSDGGAPLTQEFNIVGVVKNFHFESLKSKVSPLGLFIGDATGHLAVRLNGEDAKSVLAQAEAKWHELGPTQPFDYNFMDERFDEMYSQEQRIGNIFAAFASLAILIACLGLFALAAFIAEQRTKEISIRKVLGANVQQIVMLLSSDFMKLVSIALLIAVPIAWYSMDRWLEDYAYKVGINFWTFLLAGIIAMGIALITVSSQSIRAAHANPGDALRND